MLTTKMIGNKIAEARKKINMSQAQLAQHLFISSQAVGKWERGESMPDITTFERLAETLGVDLNYFSEKFQSSIVDSEGQSDKLSAESSPLHPSAVIPLNDPQLSSGTLKKKLNWDMSRGNWLDADFSGLKNLHEKFSSSNMQRCLFLGSDLSGLLLKSNNINNCDFSGSDIGNSRIQNSNLRNNQFKRCSLKETEFSGSNVEGCNFSGANFSDTEFSGSHITGSDFTDTDFTVATFKLGGFENNPIANAIWNGTSFNTMYIANVVFEGKLEACSFENCAFSKVTFQNSTLINTFFKNKSLKKIKFIDCKVDKMTYAFLKNGKADLSGITLMTSEIGNE